MQRSTMESQGSPGNKTTEKKDEVAIVHPDIKGRIVDVSNPRTCGNKGAWKADYWFVMVETKTDVVRVYLPATKMGLGYVPNRGSASEAKKNIGSVRKDGKLNTVLYVENKKLRKWVPLALLNPKKLVGRTIGIIGSVSTDPNTKERFVDRLQELRVYD